MEIALFVGLIWDAAVVFVDKAEVEIQRFSDLGHQLCLTVDDKVLKIKYRRLIEGAVVEGEVVSDLLFDLRTDGDTVVVFGQDRFVSVVRPVENKGGTDRIVANVGLRIDPVFHTDQSTIFQVIALELVGEHFVSQERGVFPVLPEIQLHATVDLKVRFLPCPAQVLVVDERTVKQFVMDIERDQTVVTLEGEIVVDVAGVDVA